MSEKILIVDFGSQYTQLIARTVREANVYCEIIPFTRKIELDESLRGIILSGSPFSVNEKNAPSFDLSSFAKIPILGICRGMQLIADYFGGKLTKIEGHVGNKHKITVDQNSSFYSNLKNIQEVNSYHNYAVSVLPKEFNPSALCNDGTFEAMENSQLKIFAQMWHPERTEPFDQSNLNIFEQLFNAE